jgi:signal transduction histidine kinase
MVDEWSLVGVVGFDVSTAGHRWTAEEVTILRTAADIMTHSFARIRRERTLAEQNERLEAFASVVSHDLRNPLNVVTGSLEVAQAEADSEHVDRAIRAAGRMEALIDRMLTLARAGDDIGETRDVHIGEVARSAWSVVDSRRAELRVDDDLGRTEADPDRLQEAFENLFRNSVEHGSTGNRTGSGDAVEHGGDGVAVAVGTLADGDGFFVADDGPGIPPEKRGDAFDAGYSTSADGTGFGLRIVKQVATAHGWQVWIADDPELGGARFEVSGVDVAEPAADE